MSSPGHSESCSDDRLSANCAGLYWNSTRTRGYPTLTRKPRTGFGPGSSSWSPSHAVGLAPSRNSCSERSVPRRRWSWATIPSLSSERSASSRSALTSTVIPPLRSPSGRRSVAPAAPTLARRRDQAPRRPALGPAPPPWGPPTPPGPRDRLMWLGRRRGLLEVDQGEPAAERPRRPRRRFRCAPRCRRAHPRGGRYGADDVEDLAEASRSSPPRSAAGSIHQGAATAGTNGATRARPTPMVTVWPTPISAISPARDEGVEQLAQAGEPRRWTAR